MDPLGKVVHTLVCKNPELPGGGRKINKISGQDKELPDHKRKRNPFCTWF